MKPERRNILRFFSHLAGTGLLTQLFGCSDDQSNQANPDNDAAQTKPNIVFLLADDQRYDSLGVTGNPVVSTPHLDKLALTSSNFRNCFVTTSICPVSRVSILTGQHMKRHGIDDFSTPISDTAFDQTFPGLLRKNGWTTGFIGKWGIGRVLPTELYDECSGFSDSGSYFPDGPDGDHLTSILTAQAVEFIDRNQDSPFMLNLSFKAPHGENLAFPPDPRYTDLYLADTIPRPETASPEHYSALPDAVRREDRPAWEWRFESETDFQKNVKDYFRLITGIDTAVGQIIESLHQHNLFDNTIIVFMSDNGFFLGEHELAGKWLMYEESIRIPLIVKPVETESQQIHADIDSMALNIDIAPTLLDMAGLPIPDTMQGSSLRPLMHDPVIPWRDAWYYEFAELNGLQSPRCEGVRTDRWKFIRYTGTEQAELFDMLNDPLETQNLADSADHQGLVQELDNQLQRLKLEAG